MASDGGGPGGFVPLFLARQGQVRKQAERQLGCRAAAADLAQSLFLRFWQRAPGPVGLGYLLNSARNLAHDQRRAAVRRAETGLDALADHPADTPAMDDALAARQELDVVRAALRALPERARHAFLLNRVHGRTYGEIARALGVSVSTVEKDLMRALAACRAAVAHP